MPEAEDHLQELMRGAPRPDSGDTDEFMTRLIRAYTMTSPGRKVEWRYLDKKDKQALARFVNANGEKFLVTVKRI